MAIKSVIAEIMIFSYGKPEILDLIKKGNTEETECSQKGRIYFPVGPFSLK